MKNLKYLLLFILSVFYGDVFPQVAKKIIVEHFTNTRCSICANRNPGFYNNLNNHPDILHVTYHPSSPYSSCILNQHNKSENDGRTNYYGIYGSTPKLVIQGNNIPVNVNYGDATIFDPYENETSPISMSFEKANIVSGEIEIEVLIKAEADNSLGNAKLFVALVEDTIFYNAPNGEPRHYDVFRKALTSVEGDDINLPATTGGSVVFTGNSTIHPDWDIKHIYSIVILQEENKNMIQSAASPIVSSTVSVFDNNRIDELKIYPNPVSDYFFIENDFIKNVQLSIYNSNGQLVKQLDYQNNEPIDVRELAKGYYFLKISNDAFVKEGILIKK